MPTKQDMEFQKRISGLESSVEKIDKDVNALLTNHLPHIQAALDDFKSIYNDRHQQLSNRVDELKTRIAYYIGGFAAAGFILQLVIAFYKK